MEAHACPHRAQVCCLPCLCRRLPGAGCVPVCAGGGGCEPAAGHQRQQHVCGRHPLGSRLPCRSASPRARPGPGPGPAARPRRRPSSGRRRRCLHAPPQAAGQGRRGGCFDDASFLQYEAEAHAASSSSSQTPSKGSGTVAAKDIKEAPSDLQVGGWQRLVKQRGLAGRQPCM